MRTYTQCGECVDVCPMDCVLQNEKRAYYLDAQECIVCGKCAEEWSEVFCPPRSCRTCRRPKPRIG